jgi:FeS assembly SUF system regulator
MLKISKMIDYSVLVICQMAGDQATSWSASRLADRLGLNQPTLAKICRRLAKAGMLCASRGAQGGYLLSRAPVDISLYAVVLAVEGENQLVSCEKTDSVCPCISDCHLEPVWAQIDNEIKIILQKKTMADFLKHRMSGCSIKQKNPKVCQ